MTQDEALSILQTGANVFLTGEPGSGKSHTVNRYVRYLRAHGIEPAITASTGIAATHIGGMTIHSWSSIGIKDKLTKSDIAHIKGLPHYAKRIRKAKVLVIDEVSMLDGKIFSLVDRVCQGVRESAEPFGGLQVVCVGDFFQLPPIARRQSVSEDDLWSQLPEEERGPEFAFQSEAWLALDPTVCYLTEQHRQDDPVFLEVLSAIRTDRVEDRHIRHIETRIRTQATADFAGTTNLFSHNIDVDRVNDAALEKLPGKALTFAMSVRGPKNLVAALQKGCLSPERLKLKQGAAVMFTKNHPQGKYVNGTLGTVTGFDKETNFPIVTTRSGRRVAVEPADWVVEENGEARAKITQLPLRLAWAMTIHKSQGMSLDAAVMDLSRVFEFGQGYVALSRVRRFSGLYLLGYNEQSLRVHPQVAAQDALFRDQSDKERASLELMSEKGLADVRADFIEACGGKKTESVKTKTAKAKIAAGETPVFSVETIRETHPNAYRPWSPQEDTRLRNLFSEHLEFAEIANTLGRKRGAIRARLIRLGLIEQE
ncbi:MAG: PIF1 family DEAD/DEAH box helicase [Candidatus Moraniibacteriota bacterium]